EHTIFERRAKVDAGIVLHLAVRTEVHIGVDVRTFADDAARPEHRAFPYLCLVPHARTLSDTRALTHVCRRMNADAAHGATFTGQRARRAIPAPQPPRSAQSRGGRLPAKTFGPQGGSAAAAPRDRPTG